MPPLAELIKRAGTPKTVAIELASRIVPVTQRRPHVER